MLVSLHFSLLLLLLLWGRRVVITETEWPTKLKYVYCLDLCRKGVMSLDLSIRRMPKQSHLTLIKNKKSH